MTRTPTTKDLADAGITRIVMPRTKGEGMTPEQINEEIALSAGLEHHDSAPQGARDGYATWKTPDGVWLLKPPDYYHDLNAIHGIVCGLDDDAHAKYRAWLAIVVSLRTDTKMFLMSKTNTDFGLVPPPRNAVNPTLKR